MKNRGIAFVAIIALLSSSISLAGFGGSRASSSFSSSRSFSSSSSFGGSRSSSSFGGSRSSSSSSVAPRSYNSGVFGGSRSSSAVGGATISRPSGTAPLSQSGSWSVNNTVTPIYHQPVIIHSGPSVWDYMWWHSLFYHEPVQTIVVAGQNPMNPGVMQPGQVIVEQPMHGFFYYFAWFVMIVLVLCALVGLWVKLSEED